MSARRFAEQYRFHWLALATGPDGKSTPLEALMYCTDDEMKITNTGSVTITKDGISVEGFNVKGAMCRDVAVMAAAWAIGELQREMLKTIAKPGGGKIGVD